jgi:hypothetical protein
MKKCAMLFLALSSLGVPSPAADADISLFANSVLRVRVNQLTENLPDQLRAAEPTNPVAGIILDLRFVAGGDATAAADYFTHQKLPLVILVNSQTRDAAAMLAVQLRAAGCGIVIGSTNAPQKISPDIAVAASLADEKNFEENPYAPSATNGTAAWPATNNLLSFVDHTSEAELVRQKVKDGEEDASAASPRAVPPQPVIRDPALSRAVDFLQALAVWHQSRG